MAPEVVLNTVRRPTCPSKPLTVALVSTQQQWHGGERQAGLLAEGLRRHAHRPFVLARQGGVLAERIAREGFEVATFPGNGRSPRALWQIRRQLRRLKPDVLHYNDSHAMYAAGLAAVGLPIPARVASRRVWFPLRSAAAYRLFCDRVVCVSDAVAETCRQGGIAGPRIRVVYDGVDPARVLSGSRERGRRSLGLGQRQPLLLTVATLTDCKGHTFLLEALAKVLSTEKHPRLVAVMAGDGELAEPLRQQGERLGIASHVRFVGYRDDVPDLIRAADLFVLPSHTEGLCSTLIDAMLGGCPIVTTDAGGIPELTGAGDGRCEPVAWTVPPRDPGALAAAILDALDSPECRGELAERARRRAEAMFTAEHMLQATLAVYRELVES